MRNLLPHGLGGRGHWLDMLGVDFGKVNRLPPSLLIRDFMGLPRYDGDSYFLADFLNLAQRRRCAAAILARLFADIFRRLRLGLPPP